MRSRSAAVLALVLALLLPAAASAQQPDVDPAMLPLVFPGATRIGPAAGTPPVYKAYGPDPVSGQEAVIGYVFVTTDWPPRRRATAGSSSRWSAST